MNVTMGAKGGHVVHAVSSLHSRHPDERRGELTSKGEVIRPHHVIRSFLAQMKIVDPSLLAHSRSVTYYTLLMARAIGLTHEDERKLLYSSLLHDLGQMCIDRRIIEKRERLTPEDWEVIRVHPLSSEKILSPFPCFLEITPIVRHHHERYDGTGYPDGLKGDEIPFMSRLITLTDAFVAMTSERPYRAALMISDALEIIEERKEKQFDPKLAGLFIAVVIETLKRRRERTRAVQKDQG